jgi:hypothetical protein
MRGQVDAAREMAAKIESRSWRDWAQGLLVRDGGQSPVREEENTSVQTADKVDGIVTMLRERASNATKAKAAWDEVTQLAAQTVASDELGAFWRKDVEGRTMLEWLGDQVRPDLLKDLCLLVPLLGRSDSRQHLAELEVALRDVARWWQ